MLYSEASYFDGYHFKHIADWQEKKRLERIKKKWLDTLNLKQR